MSLPREKANPDARHAYTQALAKIEACRRGENKGKILVLAGMGLTEVPPEIGQLKGLKWLNLSHNRLTSLPPEIGQLGCLKMLFLDGNRLTSLPSEIGLLSELVDLDLSENLLASLPSEISGMNRLECLHLGNNNLNELPDTILDLLHLKQLFLHQNEGLELPMEILGPRVVQADTQTHSLRNAPTILAYYFAQRTGERRPLNEVKVLVVGESEVGKTSLIRQFRGENHDPLQGKTHGIERHRILMQCGRLGEVRLNFWDFGGQDIMHATHQFFLTHRSIYLLVLDSRQNERQTRIDYWLRLISSYGGNSPVIVVCNKADQHIMKLNWTALNKAHPQIKAFVREVCCFHDGNCDLRRGLNELKTRISEAVANDVAEVDKPILKRWLSLKDELETDARDYLTLAEYHSLAIKRGIHRKQDREILLSLMHQLGSVLHFSEHAIFEKDEASKAAPAQIEELNVLNPAWVTSAIYKLLNDAALVRAGGCMSRGDMRRSLAELPGNCYPGSREDFILAMMRRFEICFAFDSAEDEWFLPDLLDKDEVDTGDWTGAMGFRYTYSVLPGSIMSRLIVRLHGYIAKGCLWRTGAKLRMERIGNCEALLRSDPEEAYLDIRIRGGMPTQRREILALIRGTIADIHRSFSDNLNVTAHVLAPGYDEVFLSYDKLLLLEESGIKSELVDVSGRLIEVNVIEALNGVHEASRRTERELAKIRNSLSVMEERKQTFRAIINDSDATSSASSVLPWWRSWPAISAWSAITVGVLVGAMIAVENATVRIVGGLAGAVFVVMISHNPGLRFRRLFQWSVTVAIVANLFGKTVAALFKNHQGEAYLHWDGSVSPSANVLMVVIMLVTAGLALAEWNAEKK